MLIPRENVFKMIKDGRTAIMLGGDIRLYDGMRTNDEIIDCLSKGCNYPKNFPLSLPEVSEYFAESNGKSQLIEKIIYLVNTPNGNSPLLETLANVKTITEIFTTAMDESMQKYFPSNDLAVVRSDIDVTFALSRPRRLYRLNGTISDSKQMIITKRDLVNRLSISSPMGAHLAYNLTSRQFLIIGHNLREWNFSFYFEQVTTQLGEFRQKAVLFCENPDPVIEKYWNKKNIEVSRESPLSFFKDYLKWEKKQ